MFNFEIVEKKDRLSWLGRPEYEVEHDKTGELLLCLTKSIHQTARYTGFCILKGLFSLVENGAIFLCLNKNAGAGLSTFKVMPSTGTLLSRMSVTQLL